MDADFTPYEAVSEELEEAERQAGLRSLRARALVPPTPDEDDLVLRWVKEYQAQRLFMHLMLLDVAEARVQDGEVCVGLSPEVAPDLLAQLSAHKEDLAPDARPREP